MIVFMLMGYPMGNNTFPIPSLNEASNEESLVLSEGTRFQLRFSLEKMYPNLDALEFYDSFYDKKGFLAICERARTTLVDHCITQ
jgi:hypothetical protein